MSSEIFDKVLTSFNQKTKSKGCSILLLMDIAGCHPQYLKGKLTSFNQKTKSKGRSILLLMDIAGCHPQYLKGKYSNIKIVFLPTQPLNYNHWILASFKMSKSIIADCFYDLFWQILRSALLHLMLPNPLISSWRFAGLLVHGKM